MSCGIDNQNSSISKGITWAKERRLWKTRWTLRTAGKQLAMLGLSNRIQTDIFILFCDSNSVTVGMSGTYLCALCRTRQKRQSRQKEVQVTHCDKESKWEACWTKIDSTVQCLCMMLAEAEEMCIIWSIYQGDVKGWCFSPENSV